MLLFRAGAFKRNYTDDKYAKTCQEVHLKKTKNSKRKMVHLIDYEGHMF